MINNVFSYLHHTLVIKGNVIALLTVLAWDNNQWLHLSCEDLPVLIDTPKGTPWLVQEHGVTLML